MTSAMQARTRGTARQALLEAALRLIRERGYAATTVDDICRAAGRTKGSFFHHFASKDALAVAVAEYWTEMTGAFFAAAAYQHIPDPLERLLGYIAFRKAILTGGLSEFTCLAGTLVQEAYDSSPEIRAACAASIFGHAGTLEGMIADARARYGAPGDWTDASLARHTQAVLQGAFILAKAAGGPGPAAESLDHLARYIRLLFACPEDQTKKGEKP